MFNLAAILIGAIIIVSGIVLLFIRSEAGISRFRLFGQEVELPAPALVVVVCGAALFVLPFFRPASDAVLWRPAPRTFDDREMKPVHRTAFDTEFVEELEPNDTVHEANLMEFGQTVRGSLGLSDAVDYFVVDAPLEIDGTRIIIRPNWNDMTHVRIYNENEEMITRRSLRGVMSFTVRPSKQYIIQLTKSGNERGNYELFVGSGR